MSPAISPVAFARRRRLAIWAPWASLMLVVLGLAWLLAGFAFRRLSILHVLAAAFSLLAAGGIPLIYAAGWMEMLYNGMVPTPRRPWLVEARDGAVHIAAGKNTVVVPLSDVEGATLVVDDSWDRMRGMEDLCLVLRLRRGGPLSVPGSSEGFAELLAAVRRAMTVDVETL